MEEIIPICLKSSPNNNILRLNNQTTGHTLYYDMATDKAIAMVTARNSNGITRASGAPDLVAVVVVAVGIGPEPPAAVLVIPVWTALVAEQYTDNCSELMEAKPVLGQMGVRHVLIQA
jgi:hypothetical protein